MKKVLNCYSGLGGNRKHWRDVSVVAVENDERIAAVYRRLFPQDEVIIGDAHQYLLEHFLEFDFIWTSPPCPTHSRMQKATRHKLKRYPSMELYQEILMLKHFAKCPWVVENVIPYYTPLIKPDGSVGRHIFWSSGMFLCEDVPTPSGFINMCNVAGKISLMDWLGIHYEENIYLKGNHCPAQILRNCVHPTIGKTIFDQLAKP